MDKAVYTFAHTNLATGISTTATFTRSDEATYDEVAETFLVFLSGVYGYTISVDDLNKQHMFGSHYTPIDDLPPIHNRRSTDMPEEV